MRAAQRKLAAALPSSWREDEARARQRIHLDATWWTEGDEPASHLRVLYEAVWEGRRLRLHYQHRFVPRGHLMLDHMVAPYGLVAKASHWHLVAAHKGRMRVYVVAQIVEAVLLDEAFTRSPDFDLSAFWREWCEEAESGRGGFVAIVRVSSELVADVKREMGNSCHATSAITPRDTGDWVTISLTFESLDAARGRLLALGGAVEVLEPVSLRLSLADYAAQILARYR